jgi:hypothetical protein
MRRLHLFEIEDQAWCPRWLRDAMTDYLAEAHRLTAPYAPAVPTLEQALRRDSATDVVDLCSGAGGPWPQLLPQLRARGLDLQVRLTDLHPNGRAVERWQANGLEYVPYSVPGVALPAGWRGFRTLFSSLHHFRPADARALLGAARTAGVGFAAFEATQRSAKAVLVAQLLPLATWILTPFIRPRRLSRFACTYLVPILPLALWWDGTVSCLRTYTVAELWALVADLGGDDYTWEAGSVRGRGGPIPITYLVGAPVRAAGVER